MELSLITKPLIISFLAIIFINISHNDAQDVEQCTIWNQYCERANGLSNKNFECIDNAIYYYDPDKTEWDTARRICSLKFGASYLADLVQVPNDDTISSTVKMLKYIGLDSEIATGGVCCMKKMDGSSAESIDCQFLATGEKIPPDFETSGVADKCKVFTIQLNPSKSGLNGKAISEKSGLKLPILCSFNLPRGCAKTVTDKPDISTTTTEVPHTDDHVSLATDKHQTEPSNPTTVSTSPEHSHSTETPPNIHNQLEDIHSQVNISANELDSTKLLRISIKFKDVLNQGTLEQSSSLKLSMEIVDLMEAHSIILDHEPDKLLNFSKNVVESVSRVLDSHNAWERVDNTTKVQMSSNILHYIQRTGFNLGCRPDIRNGSTIKINKPNIVIKTFTMDYKSQTKFTVNGKDSSVTIPAGIPEPQHLGNCNKGTAVGSMFDKLSRYLSDHLEDNFEINSNIVAFSIDNNTNSTELPKDLPPVTIVVQHNTRLQFGDRVQCVYWDFDQMNWSSKGCRFQQINSNRKLSICECNHLTNFAALMDVSGRETDTKAKDILTKVCCGLSIICLLLTIGSLTLVRALRNRRNNITSNLCFCLLIVNLLVVFGMDSTQNNGLCQTVAALLLYFILCSFSWMLMEGYHLYQMIVLVFSNVGHLRVIYLYAIGYGAPLLIAFSAYLGIGFKNLKDTDSYFCWISSPSHPYRIWAVAAPASIAILANGLIMFLALKEAFSAKIKKKLSEKDFTSDSTIAEKLSQSFSWIKGFISLVVVLGITWISFVLYIHEFGQYFSYIFIILNGLQGVFIFIFQILLNEKARTFVRKSCQKRMPSRYLSSLYRTTSTNVFTSRSKSISRDKNSTENINNSNGGYPKTGRANDTNNSTFGSHRSQSISMNRIRNASDSILF